MVLYLNNTEINLKAAEKKTSATPQGIYSVRCSPKQSPETMRTLFTGLQRVVNYLLHNGFSIGISDAATGRKTIEYITE